MIKGPRSETVRSILEKIPLRKRNKVLEITLDMAVTMGNIARFSFPNARLVTDRLHVQKLAYDALQKMRIHYQGRLSIRKKEKWNWAKNPDKSIFPISLKMVTP